VPCVASGAFLPHAIELRAIINSYAPIIMRSPHPSFLRNSVAMPNRDSWASALAPRLSPKAWGSIPRELKLQAFPPQPAALAGPAHGPQTGEAGRIVS
jgi:hypothetical protein